MRDAGEQRMPDQFTSWLTYSWLGWKVEFQQSTIQFTNPANGDVWRISLDPYSDLPFMIQLIERGKR
jgi:hypothetical protein